MQINEAHSLLEAWQLRMRPATAPYGRPAVREQWVKRLELSTQAAARAAWTEWLADNPRRFPNLYELDTYIKRHSTAGTEHDSCDLCDTTGWVEAPDFVENGHTYTSSQPCTCTHGQERSRSRIWTEQ